MENMGNSCRSHLRELARQLLSHIILGQKNAACDHFADNLAQSRLPMEFTP